MSAYRLKTPKPMRSRRSGQVFIIFVFALLVLMAVCVFTIDIGRMFLVKAQLQNAVDSAALAGGSELTTTNLSEDDKNEVRSEAEAFAGLNRVEGEPLTLSEADIDFGHYNEDTRTFIPEAQASVIDSVRITGTHTADLFFGGIFGWNEIAVDNVVGVATKPRRYVMFALDRSGSMCFDTSGVTCEGEYQGTGQPVLDSSASGWYYLPDYMYIGSNNGSWQGRPWFRAQSGRTDFLPEHIKDHLRDGEYFNFRPRDNPDSITSGWIKVPLDVTIEAGPDPYDYNWDYIYSNYYLWNYLYADGYFHVIYNDTGYAHSTSPVQPLQDSMDAAEAFVDLMRPEDDRAGLVTYAYDATLNQQLTTDMETVKDKLQSYAPHGATAEPDAMEEALDELIDSGRAEGFGQRVMVLLTDGNANTYHGNSGYSSYTRTYELLGEQVTSDIDPDLAEIMAQQAERARQNDVRIYCVTFGDDVDTEVHRVIAQHTNAAYYYAENHEDLTDIFVDIFRRLPPIITR